MGHTSNLMALRASTEPARRGEGADIAKQKKQVEREARALAARPGTRGLVSIGWADFDSVFLSSGSDPKQFEFEIDGIVSSMEALAQNLAAWKLDVFFIYVMNPAYYPAEDTN